MFYTKEKQAYLEDKFNYLNQRYDQLNEKYYALQIKHETLLQYLGLYEQKVPTHTILRSSEKCTTQMTNN